MWTPEAEASHPHALAMKIPFPTEREAEIAFTTMSVDEEISSNVLKKIERNGTLLLLKLRGKQLKNLRVSLGSFLDMLLLTCETMEMYPGHLVQES